MPTLDELIAEHTKDGKRPDELRIAHCSWLPDQWFQPFYKCRNGFWHGLIQNNANDFYEGRGEWKLYTEPKPKVKRAQYLYQLRGGKPRKTTRYYKDDSEFIDCGGFYDLLLCERVIETEREFDE